MIGGNSVGLFVSEVQPGRKEVQVGDQILQINGQSTCAMMHYQATHLLRSQREKVTLNVMKNSARESTSCATLITLTQTMSLFFVCDLMWCALIRLLFLQLL